MSKRPSVLLVEDELLVAQVLSQELEEAGYEVEHVEEGAAAIARLEAAAADFVALVADIRLHGALSGWDVARFARQARHDMPVIYMSGDSAGDWDVQGVPRSVILEKPFAPSQLIVALASAVTRSG